MTTFKQVCGYLLVALFLFAPVVSLGLRVGAPWIEIATMGLLYVVGLGAVIALMRLMFWLLFE